MEIISNNPNFKVDSPTVVAIGKFDGDHIGHQKLFSVMRDIKANEGLQSAALTFAFFDSPQISTILEKRERLEVENLDYLIEYPFTDAVRTMEAEDFLKDILIGRLNMKHIVAGPDCSFGHNRRGNVQLLQKYALEYGYKVTIIDKIMYQDQIISSSLIRDLINEGNVSQVTDLMGQPYSIKGTVSVGNKKGAKELGFPTVNIMITDEKIFPKIGVYATEVILPDKRVLKGVTNIGTNPTILDDKFKHALRCETHILDFDENLYDKTITVRFKDHLRDERRFASVDELKKQLIKDVYARRK